MEVLFDGTMRTAASDWFHAGQAWFPADLLNVYRTPETLLNVYRTPPVPSENHPAFESEDNASNAHNEVDNLSNADNVDNVLPPSPPRPQVWVQVRVAALRERPVVWVKIEGVRRVKASGVVPTLVGEEAEVCQIEDGGCIWYRGRLMPPPQAPCLPTPSLLKPGLRVRLYGHHGDASMHGQAAWQDGRHPGQGHVCGPVLCVRLTANMTHRVRRAMVADLSPDDAADMVPRILPLYLPARACVLTRGLHLHTGI